MCLTVSSNRLVKTRTNKLRSLKESSDIEYVDVENIRERVGACRKYCAGRGWYVIDATRRSIEETAAAILSLYKEKPMGETLFTERAKNK